MACVNADGTLTPSAKTLLAALREPLTLAVAAERTGLPLFRIRSGARELVDERLLEAQLDGRYRLTAAGAERLRE